MRVLILSGNTGEGHNSCAKAIKEIYDIYGVDCVIEDGFGFISDKTSRFLSKGHSFVYKHVPILFDKGYHLAEELPDSFSEDSVIYSFFARGCGKLYEYITREGFDTVICTHPFTAIMLTEVKREYDISIKTAFVATDYTCSPSVKDSNLDVYFIPSESLVDDFECENITRDKMCVSGIPVRQMFYEKKEKSIARKTLHLPEDSKHIVVACGSMGCGPIKELIELLFEWDRTDLDISVLCGKNKKLYDQLSEKYSLSSKIHICEYIKRMSLMLDSADLYITKAGGISTTEALIKGLPMVIVDAVGGCEDYNKDFFVKSGVAYEGKYPEDIMSACEELLDNTDKYAEMEKALQNMGRPNSAKIIYELLNR